ncbi:MAG: Uma2 family endonuclease [Candidatus Parabeggiatoa sp. nov. 2]|nr:MAG: Uma2 family endonuclease [Gammaproteobacteria bacterium]
MSEVIELNDEVLEDEEADMPSLRHSGVQTNLTVLLGSEEKFETFVELSLDASEIDLSRFKLKAKDELVPDVCVYTGPPPTFDEDVDDDLLKVSQMPDLAIEVLSPSQSVSSLVRKIKAYFALNVKSCWLVMPSVEVINVYSQNDKRTFDMNDTEVVDEVIDIRLPIQKIFRRHSKETHP